MIEGGRDGEYNVLEFWKRAGKRMGTIFHLIDQAGWDVSQGGTEHRAESLASEGFIHCSEDAEQLLRVAERLYGGREDLLALEVEVDRLGSPLKREPSRSGEIYPHIYGPLNLDAVVKVWRLPLGESGSHYLAEE